MDHAFSHFTSVLLKPQASSGDLYFQSQQRLDSDKDVADIQVQLFFVFVFPLRSNMISENEECGGSCESECLGMSQGDGLHTL